MNRVLIILLIFLGTAYGEEPIIKVELPTEVRQELRVVHVPEEIKGKVWNRWTSDNFTVLNLNDVHAQYLHKHLELVKVWAVSRWGLYDAPFSAECKIIGVDDPNLFEKMFSIDRSKVEIRRDTNGKIQQSVIFVLTNDVPSRTIPIPLTEVCLAEFAQRYNVQLGLWAYRGMAVLNGDLEQIRENLLYLLPMIEGNSPIYFSEGLFKMTAEQYKTLSEDKRKLYDACSTMLCLMIRKEFGQDKFHWFLKKSSEVNAEAAVVEVLEFNDCADFDRTFKRYIVDLMRDLRQGKTPDQYLQIRESTSSSTFAFSS